MKKLSLIFVFLTLAACSKDDDSVNTDTDNDGNGNGNGTSSIQHTITLTDTCPADEESTYTEYCVSEETHDAVVDAWNDEIGTPCFFTSFTDLENNEVEGYFDMAYSAPGACED